MATVNSRFLAIGSGEPNINSGWTIRVLDYKDMTSLVAVISEFSAFSFTQELNGTGTGSITMDEDSPFWTAILDNGNSNRTLLNNEYVFEAWDNNTPRFAWVAQTVTNSIEGEDETRAITIAGPGIAQVLTWAIIHRPAWPTAIPTVTYVSPIAKSKTTGPRDVSASDKIPALGWRFPVKWPTMRMWYTVLKAAQRRGVIPWVTPMFGALKDSGNQPWIFLNTLEQVTTQIGYQPSTPGESLLDFLNECTGQDYSKWFGQKLEWLMYPGFKLDVRRKIGSDRSKTVRFFAGNILSDERTRDRESIFNTITAVDVYGSESIRTDKKSVTAWNIREQRNETNKNVTDTNLRGQLADRYLAQTKDQKDQWSIKIPYDDPGRVPYRNFFVGDYIGVNDEYLGSTPTAVAAPTKYRVMAITVSVTTDSVVPDCELTLQSMIDSKQNELEKQITRLINNPLPTEINNVKQITITSTPVAGQVLTWNEKTQQWENQSPSTTTHTGTGSIYIQKSDPATVTGNTVAAGDFWLETYD